MALEVARRLIAGAWKTNVEDSGDGDLLPDGGNPGQALIKASSDAGDASWETVFAQGSLQIQAAIPFGGMTQLFPLVSRPDAADPGIWITAGVPSVFTAGKKASMRAQCDPAFAAAHSLTAFVLLSVSNADATETLTLFTDENVPIDPVTGGLDWSDGVFDADSAVGTDLSSIGDGQLMQIVSAAGGIYFVQGFVQIHIAT